MIEYYKSIQSLPLNLDIVIVATSANIRRMVIDELLEKRNVSYLILEKVLFQKLEDYDYIKELMQIKNVKAWVNCPRRTWEIFQILKNELEGAKFINFEISGSSWGLGSNCIHYLDLIGYLTGNFKFKLNGDLLDSEIIASKREKFSEFHGSIQGKGSDNVLFTISSLSNSDLPFEINITSDKLRCRIADDETNLIIASSNSNWEWEDRHYDVPYQSQLTDQVVNKLIEDKTCDLPTYSESTILHQPFIELLLNHYRENVDPEANICPIT